MNSQKDQKKQGLGATLREKQNISPVSGPFIGSHELSKYNGIHISSSISREIIIMAESMKVKEKRSIIAQQRPHYYRWVAAGDVASMWKRETYKVEI